MSAKLVFVALMIFSMAATSAEFPAIDSVAACQIMSDGKSNPLLNAFKLCMRRESAAMNSAKYLWKEIEPESQARCIDSTLTSRIYPPCYQMLDACVSVAYERGL